MLVQNEIRIALGDVVMNRDKHNKGRYNPYKLNGWRLEFRTLAKVHGMTPSMLCEYLGLSVSDKPSFWMKMPMKREIFIGLGMALKQPLNVINRWITIYGDKKKLYVKDIMSDLVWIYLIEANCRDMNSDINYYKKYESVRSVIESVYLDIWREEQTNIEETYEVEKSMENIEYSEAHIDISRFVERHIGDITSAYSKPRHMLRDYVEAIVKVLDEAEEVKWNLSRLRGYLDDSMVNYLAGDPDYFNVIDRKTKTMTPVFKTMPVTKEAHVRICMALGMTEYDINKYLELMGYAPLSEAEPVEKQLISVLGNWENNHSLQRTFKNQCIYGINTPEQNELTLEEQVSAVEQILELRAHVSQRVKNMKE